MMGRPVVFMYSGQGAQYYQMGKELYASEPLFKESLERCAKIVDPLIGTSLVAEIYRGAKAEPFEQTRFTHPANAAVAYSLTQVLLARGVRPDYLVGYSLGEYIAAIVSGATTLDAGLRHITQQGLDIERLTPPGTMLAILEQKAIMQREARLFEGATLACDNFANHFVVSGPRAVLKRIEQTLQDRDTTVQMLPISHGFHSEMIEPAEQAVVADLAGGLGTPQIPCYSAATQGLVAAFSASHLWRVLRGPVLFHGLLQGVERSHQATYVDVGPSGTLATFAKYLLGPTANGRIYSALTPFGRDLKTLDTVVTALCR